MDVLVVVEVNLFLLEGSDVSFSISVLPRTPSPGNRNLNIMMPEHRDAD